MWTPIDRALVGDFGAGQALSDEQYCLLEPLIPPPARKLPSRGRLYFFWHLERILATAAGLAVEPYGFMVLRPLGPGAVRS